MKSLKDKIEYYITKYPELRDNDRKLVSTIWLKESSQVEVTSAYNLLKMYADKKLSDAGSIIRLRRLIQVDNPELRGKKYLERMKKQEKVKKDLKNLKK